MQQQRLRRCVPRIVACDLGSKASFAAAGATIHLLMERLGYSHESKRQCPVSVLLVGNKVACPCHAHAHTHRAAHARTAHHARLDARLDARLPRRRQVDVGARRQVGPTDCGELLVRYVQPGMLLPQIRKLKLAPALLKVVATAVQYKRNALEGQKDKTLGGVPTMGDEISIELFKAMQVRPPPQALPHLPQPPASPRGLCIAAAAPQRAGPAARLCLALHRRGRRARLTRRAAPRPDAASPSPTPNP